MTSRDKNQTLICHHHPGVRAEYVCEWCDQPLCSDCVTPRQVAGLDFVTCACGGRCRERAVVSGARAVQDSASNLGYADAITYPFRGHGLLLLGVGAFVFGLLGFVAIFPLIGLIIQALIFGFLCAYAEKVIASSGDGDPELPDWPDVTDLFGDIIAPALRILTTVLICMGPGLAAYFFLSPPLNFLLGGAGMLIGVFCLPMALLSVALTQSLGSLNPACLIPSMFKTGLDYFFVFMVLAVAMAVKVFLTAVMGSVPLFGFLVAGFISLVLLVFQLRIIGLFYYRNRTRLNWF